MFGKPKSFLGIDIGAGGVKLVELIREKNRPVLFTYGLTSQPEEVHRLLKGADINSKLLDKDFGKAEKSEKNLPQFDDAQIDRLSNVIKSICKQAKVRSKIATASLPVSAVFHTVVTIPKVKKEEFNIILKAEVKKLLPYAVDDTAIDYQVLPGEEEKSEQVLVSAVPRSLVAFYTKIFNRAGLKLDALEPESAALARSLVGRDKSTNMLVDIGAERTNFFIVDQGVPVTHHTIEVGGKEINRALNKQTGIPPEILDQIKKDAFEYLATPQKLLPAEQFIDMFNGVLDPIVKEIEFSFDLYLRQSGNSEKRPEKIILTGGASLFPFLHQRLAETFKVKCFVGDPWGRVVYQDALKPVLRQIGPRMAVAIGLALRNVV